ncbi:MAG TPA: von Willebrand factor type A domain-containing protein [Bacteroidales bacterium]|nr:von Willebrand factor type A domain-containing protein [Bacteroidales bacterium]
MKKIMLIVAVIILMTSGTMQRVITGKVVDSDNNPLPGVNVVIKGTTNGTVTDGNGTFSISVTENDEILIFTYIGYVTEEVRIGSSSSLLVMMMEDIRSLEEVVVVRNGTQRKKEVASAAPEISTDAMQGKVAGITIRGMATNNYGSRHQNFKTAPQFNTEGYTAVHENNFKSPLKEPLSTFSIDVDAASYSNIRRFINEGQKPVKDAVRIEEMINYFDYDYPQPDNGHPFAIVQELGECPWNSDHKLLHIGLQGEKMKNNEIPPSNLVFLIDVSGSMDYPNKLPLVVKAMRLLVSQLRAEDRVAIVVYAGSSGLVLPSTPGNQKERITDALDRLRAGGSTAGSAGLKLAYEIAEENFMKEGNNRIILATDGDFNVGPSSNAEMERLIETYRNKGIFISVAGFGMGNYKDDKMEIIADKGNGNYAYIDNLMEARKVFINEFSSTLYTIAKDVKIQIEFNPAYVKEYRLVGYENRLLNEEDFDDDKKDAGELGAGHSVTALYEIVPAGNYGDQYRRLRYQLTDVMQTAAGNNELATIQLRYKKPDADKSILMTEVIPYSAKTIDATSNNFRFSAAVAGFGLLLRNSDYKGSINYDQVLSLARSSKGDDKDGYRAEFIRLVELSESGLTSMVPEE